MRSTTLATCVAALLASSVLLGPSALSGQGPVPGLDGAWQIADMSAAGGQTLSSPQPGLLLFVGSFYSYTLVTGDQPRPLLPSGAVTTADLLRVWNPFSANAGTFEVSGETMIRRPMVAKNPATMAPGAYNEYTFRLAADTLWVTTVGTETGPARNPTTVRYLRLP